MRDHLMIDRVFGLRLELFEKGSGVSKITGIAALRNAIIDRLK